MAERRGFYRVVERMGERRGLYRVVVGKPGGKNHLEDLSLDGRIMREWFLKKWF
jgi:hypothetical protein